MRVTVMQGTGAAQGARPASGAQSAPPAPGTPQAQGNPSTPVVAQPPTARELRDQLRRDIQNSIRNGQTPVINLPTDFVRNAVPTGAVQISIAFFVTIAAMVIFTPLARAAARRSDSKIREAEETARNLHPQLAQLQDSVDAMAIELERISESQRFQAKLLAGKEPARVER